ncbi:hypothetical protein PHMEG_00017648, partial [Phytophthora megakarya]
NPPERENSIVPYTTTGAATRDWNNLLWVSVVYSNADEVRRDVLRGFGALKELVFDANDFSYDADYRTLCRSAGVKALACILAEELEGVAGPAMNSDDDGAMGCESQRFPSDATLDDWAPADAGTTLRKWKKKLRPATSNPVKQNESSTGVFVSKGSPYMRDSHMQPDCRYDLNEDSSDDGRDRFDVDHLEGDLTKGKGRHIRELSVKEEKKSTPRIEITTHSPLVTTQDPPHVETLERRVYQVLLFQVQQSAKARYYSAKREDKEHVCDYLNRLNGYARNAVVQFENGGREAKDHVEHFLDTSQDGSRRRDISRNEDSMSNYRRDHHYRGESPYRPRISLADALSDLVTALNEISVGLQTSHSGSYDHAYESNEDLFGDGERLDDEGRYANRGSEYDYAGEDERGHVAVANDHERRAAAEGTFARWDNQRSKESDDGGDGVNYRYSVKTCEDSEASVAPGLDEEFGGKPDTRPTEFSDAGDDKIDPTEYSVDMLELTYISVMQEIEAEIISGNRSDDDDLYEHIPNEMKLADYAHELAFLPDLTKPSLTVLDYTGPNVTNKSLSEDEQQKHVEVLKRYEGIMIASADAKKIKRVTEFSFPTSKKGMQSFLGALNHYSRFVQDFAVYAAALYLLKEEDFGPSGDLSVARQSFAKLQQQIGDAPILRHYDRQKETHVTLFANEWALSSTLMQEHDCKMHSVRFCGRVLNKAEMNYHPAEKEVLALLLLLKT